MARYSPSALRLVDDYCPRALSLRGAEGQDRSIFDVGTAAHLMLERLQSESIAAVALGREGLDESELDALADAVTRTLISGGSSWEGRPRDPMRPSAATEGVDLALQWHRTHGAVTHEGARAEVAVGFDATPRDRAWTIAPFESAKRFRLVFDVVWEESIEGVDQMHTIVVARDYKTSWTAGEADLQSAQMHAQAIAALDMFPEAEAVRIEIAAVRTRKVFSALYDRRTDAELLMGMRSRLSATLQGLDAQRLDEQGRRVATPSYRCGGCPMIAACPEGSAHVRSLATVDTGDPVVDVAASYVALSDLVARQRAVLREATREESITVDGGATIGHHTVTRQTPAPRAAASLVAAWGDGQEWTPDTAAGLVLALSPGVEALERATKALVPGRKRADIDERRALLATLIAQVEAVEFGTR